MEKLTETVIYYSLLITFVLLSCLQIYRSSKRKK
jgi:hypothetical protein